MCPHSTGVKCCTLNALLQPKVSEILSDHAFTSGDIPFLAGQCCSEIVRGILSGTVLVRAFWKLRTLNHSHFQPTLSQKHLSPSKLLENVCIQCIPSAYHSFCVTTYIWENGLLPAVCVVARLPVSQPSQVYAQLLKIPPVLLVNWHRIFLSFSLLFCSHLKLYARSKTLELKFNIIFNSCVWKVARPGKPRETGIVKTLCIAEVNIREFPPL